MVKLSKKYLDFINQCKNKNYGNLLTHKHHILPVFMGGSNDELNLIILSVEDHYKAHVILSETSEDINHKIGNRMSSLYLINRYENIKVSKEEISKMMSECKKFYYQHNEHWNKGNKGKLKHTEDSKKSISSSLKMFYADNVIWNKNKNCPQISKALKGKMSGFKNPFYGKKHTNETKEKMKNNHHDVSGSNNPSAKKWVDIETKQIYGSIKELSEKLNLSRGQTTRFLNSEKNVKYKKYE